MTIFRHRMTGPAPAGDVWNVTMHSYGTVTASAAHDAWLQFLSSFIGGVVEPLWSTQTQATEAITDELSGITGQNVSQTRSSLSYKGTGTGTQLPQRAAAVIGLRTALPTRAGRGRFYLPAPDSSNLATDGEMTTATATALAAGASSALATFGITLTPVIFHRKTLTWDKVVSVTVSPVLGSQRRRTNKVPADYASSSI